MEILQFAVDAVLLLVILYPPRFTARRWAEVQATPVAVADDGKAWMWDLGPSGPLPDTDEYTMRLADLRAPF